MMPYGASITEQELDAALDEAATGMTRTDLGVNEPIREILTRVATNRAVSDEDAAEAHRLRQEMEDEENLAEASSGQ
jgi:hypothetical protein